MEDMLRDNEIIERMNMRDEMLAEQRAAQKHEYKMRTDSDYFEKYSEWLDRFLEARENLILELRKYGLEYMPEDFL